MTPTLPRPPVATTLRDGDVAADGDVDDAAARMYVVIGRLVRTLRRAGAAGLGPGAMAALATLSRVGPMRLGDLAAREGVAPPTLTRIVAGLEEAGYVERQVDPADRRAVRVTVTPEGARVAGGVRCARSAVLRDRVRALPAGQVEAILAAMPALEALADDEAGT